MLCSTNLRSDFSCVMPNVGTVKYPGHRNFISLLKKTHPDYFVSDYFQRGHFSDNASFTISNLHKWRLKIIRGMIVFRRMFEIYSLVLGAQWEAY